MELAMKFLIGIIIAVFVLIVTILIYNELSKNSIDPINNDILKRNLCAKWVMNNCNLTDNVYKKDLVEAKFCQPCELLGDTTKIDPARLVTAMENACGETGDKTWSDCKKMCGCPTNGR
jgi:hypothetical protein